MIKCGVDDKALK